MFLWEWGLRFFVLSVVSSRYDFGNSRRLIFSVEASSQQEMAV